MILVYVYLLFSIGFSFNYILKKKNIIKSLNKFEEFAFISTSGLTIFVLYMLVLGYLKVPLARATFIPIILNGVFVTLLIIYRSLKNIRKLWNMDFEEIWSHKITILLFSSLILWILYAISVGLSNFLMYSDEYAVWALNAKNIYLSNKLNFFINTGLEVYPDMMPLLSSGFYIFNNKIVENCITIFSGIYFLIGALGIMGYGIRKKLNINFIILCLLFGMTNYNLMFTVTTNCYADIPYMATYALGIIYFVEWIIFDRRREYLFISAVNMMAYSFMKPESIYLTLFTVVIALFIKFFEKKFNIIQMNTKSLLIYSISILFFPISWKLYTILAKFPEHLFLGGSDTINFKYTVSLFENMSQQFFQCIPWALLFIIFIVGLALGFKYMKFNEKKYILICLVFILANVGFLVASYLLVFGAEAITAASFIRYLTRVYMIAIIIDAYLIKSVSNNL